MDEKKTRLRNWALLRRLRDETEALLKEKERDLSPGLLETDAEKLFTTAVADIDKSPGSKPPSELFLRAMRETARQTAATNATKNAALLCPLEPLRQRLAAFDLAIAVVRAGDSQAILCLEGGSRGARRRGPRSGGAEIAQM